MFRRRRRHAEPEADAAAPAPAPAPARESGPWDADESYPERGRVDLGGLLLPVIEGSDIRLIAPAEQIVGVAVLVDESALQLHVLAAPRSSGLWDEVRAELAEGVKKAGGTTEEREGSFGTELIGRIPVEGQDAQTVRYVGVDGPRWLLHAVFSGRAATDEAAAEPLEVVVRDVVVVRGEGPMAPKDTIELRQPPETHPAGDDAEGEGPDLDPFRRGPEITETR
ncbi:DUF3710 domain-containing protein [Spongiactinospora rosea]|uniref:DUF3710 domain-containing protein n=1 Tax=Spongiactinospora rosea TaxID=2248750 RepID=A0A366M1Z6_9ACTN|nr:DUF3710 domain-containing protein [Spongiactinospora rosea]RBQ19649.1 DUF3710 domain-containing protein [Spongiactinospora rosea]